MRQAGVAVCVRHRGRDAAAVRTYRDVCNTVMRNDENANGSTTPKIEGGAATICTPSAPRCSKGACASTFYLHPPVPLPVDGVMRC